MECVPVFSHCKAPKLNCEATGFVVKVKQESCAAGTWHMEDKNAQT